MHRRSLAALAALVAAGPALASDPLTLEVATEVLDNGLTVIVAEDHRTDSVALHITYGVGSRDEVDGEHGCAHLFEHLMFEGSANVPTNAFDDWLTAAGGDNNAWTSTDETAYHMVFPSGALDLALFLESDRLGFLDAGLDQDNLTNQQSVVLQERYQGFAEPHGRDWDALARLMYPPGHPYHVPVIGTVADVEGFSLDQVLGFWDRHYRTQNAVLVLVGHVETGVALERVRHWFSDVPDRGEPVARSVVPDALPDVPREGYITDKVEDRSVTLAWRTVPETHADSAALDILGWVLSGGRGTRLDDRMYYESRLTTEVGAGSYTQQLDGEFVMWAATDRKKPEKLVKVAQSVLDDLFVDPPTEDEIDRARRMIKADLLDQLELPRLKAGQIAWCQVTWGTVEDCLVKDWQRYEAVSPIDLLRVAGEYLTPERRTVLTVVAEDDVGVVPDGAVLVEVP